MEQGIRMKNGEFEMYLGLLYLCKCKEGQCPFGIRFCVFISSLVNGTQIENRQPTVDNVLPGL